MKTQTIQKTKNILKDMFKAIVYPPKSLINFFLLTSTMSIKMFSTERAKLFSKLFEHYFLQINKAKIEKRKVEIEIDFEELGSVMEYLKTSLQTTFGIIILIYLIFGFIASSLISGLLVALGIPFDIVLSMGAIWSVIAITYYIGLAIYLGKKYVLNILIDQKFLKQAIYNETAYIYSKSCDIDEEVANITMQHLSSSLLLTSQNQNDENLKKIIGVEK